MEAICIWNLEEKLIKMTLIGGSHFYGLLAYRSTERKNVFKLKREFNESNPYMKF